MLKAVTELATGLLGDALTDPRLASALSRLTSAQLDTVTAQLTTLQNNCGDLAGIAISDIDQWLTGLLACLSTVSDLLNSLIGFGVQAEVTSNVQSWTTMLWAAGTLIQRIISWADDVNSGSPFGTDTVTPDPPASVATIVKPVGGSVTYTDVAAYLIGSKVVAADLETALRAAIPQSAAAFDWLNTVLQITPGQLVQSLFQELAAPSDQQAAALIGQLTTAAADALTNHILPELLDPLAAATAADANLSAFVEDVVKPALAALPQVILPGLANLGDADAPTRTREVVSALLLHIIEHFMSTTLKGLVDHAMTAAQAALNQAAADVSAAGADSPAVKDIEALAIVLLATCSEAAVLVPTPGDVANLLTLAGAVAADLQQLADDLFALIDELMQFGLGSDATRSASLQALANSDLPVNQTGLSQALSKVGDGALKTIGDVLSDLPTLIADHAANEVALFVQVIDQVAGKAVQAIKDGISAIQTEVNQLEQWIQNTLIPEIQKLLGELGGALTQFGQHVQTLIPQAVEAVRNAGLQIIESLMGGPPHSWVQHAIVDLYNALFDAVEGLADLLGGILGTGATALGNILTAAAGGAHVTQDTADAAVRQGLLAASSTDLNFDLQVKALGATLLDLGTITISAGNIGGVLHDLVSADGTYQSTLQTGMQTATQAAGLTAQQAAAQTQAATGSADLTALQEAVGFMTLAAPPVVQIVTPAPGTALPFGARVLITVSGVFRNFLEPTLGVAPRVVIRVNGLPWSYQSSDWSDDAQDPMKHMLQADLIAMPLPGYTAPATTALPAQSITTTPGATAVFDPQADQLQLQADPASTPSGTPVPDPQLIDVSQQPPWTQRALLHQALQDPSGTATGQLTGQGRVTAPGTARPGLLPIVASSPPWVLAGPPPDPLVSHSIPAMIGKFGLNTLEVAVADGAGHTATAATTVVILPGPPLYAISAKYSGSCLTIAGGEVAVTPGASAQQWPWVGSRNQMWKLEATQAGGGYWLAADHSGLPLGVNSGVPAGDFDDWRMCRKCQGLFLQDWSTPATCVEGGTHDPAGSPDYFLANSTRLSYILNQCAKCSCLFVSPAGSACFAGGTHEAPASKTHWGLDPQATPSPGSPSWQWCVLCGMLVPAGGGSGVCPAGGGHDTTPGSQALMQPASEADAVSAATLVLPASGADAANGTPLVQGGQGGPWQLLPAPDPRYRVIRRQENQKVAEVADVSAPWSDWNMLSQAGDKAKLLALAAYPDGRMHALMVGLDYQTWHNEQSAAGVSAPWTGWQQLSPSMPANMVALAAHPDGRMHAAMVGGDDNQTWHNEQTAAGVSAAWTGWEVLSQVGDVANLLALAAHPDGRMHALMEGLDNQIWHNEQTAAGVSAPWTDWHYLSAAGDKAVQLALAAHPDGRMHAVMAGPDNQIWHNEQTAAGVSAPWTDWHYLSAAGDKAVQLALAAHPDGRMHAVMAGPDNQIWHNEQTAAGVSAPWTDWHYLSAAGDKAVQLALAAHPDGRMHAVMAGPDNQIWLNQQTAAGVSAPWTGWHVLSNPGNKALQLALAAHPDGRMHAVMAGLDNQIWHNEQTVVVIDQWDWLGGDNQQWRLTPVPEIDPAAYYAVTAKHSGKVLEVQGGPTATGERRHSGSGDQQRAGQPALAVSA